LVGWLFLLFALDSGLSILYLSSPLLFLGALVYQHLTSFHQLFLNVEMEDSDSSTHNTINP